ncbi:MAG: hypothetical protein J4224_00985 [Candidatus Diapherotrites archaeon]|uniref:Uncharacterized protein n=1 Tax=Candidatus Iainarchaeum sp. TaxID=3101447 RepID=A0A7J4ITZ7_9ARCH|nr:MAG: hypothetical protein QT03_C0001G0215 [archaeon GW2011_AR10]MBS3058984.1 hypothetical protein [Candidatus Diapherotrites archaeon]HIH08988.1 hypothetical protein [Candidatus Diapherotrites archaeon]
MVGVKGQADPNLPQITFGVFLVALSVVLLLGSLDLLDFDRLPGNANVDVFIAFGVLAIGLIYVFGYLNPRKNNKEK